MLTAFEASELFHAPEAPALRELLEGGRLPALFSGLPAASRAQLAAVLARTTEQSVLVVCADDAAAEVFARDAAALLEREVPLLPARDYTFYTAESVSRQTEQRRLRALHALLTNEAPVVVATVAGLLQRAIPPEKLRQVSFEVADGGSVPPEDVEDALLRCGYVRTQQVEGPGQFSRRGGILDLFSPADLAPIRIEFWGDDIDSMSRFDIESQRRTDSLPRCRILPAAETLTTLSPGGAAAFGEKLTALSERAAKRKNAPVATALANTLRADGERLSGGGTLPAADRYMGVIYSEFSTALDYLAPDAIVLLDQPGRCADRAKEYAKLLGEDVAQLTANGTLAARADQFYRPWSDTVRKIADYALFYADSFTLGRYPVDPKAVCGIVAKQLPSYGGSVQTAAGDIAHYLSMDFRVVVLAGDKRRAERHHAGQSLIRCGISARQTRDSDRHADRGLRHAAPAAQGALGPRKAPELHGSHRGRSRRA